MSFPPVAPTAKTMPESHLPSHSITLETFLATKIMRLTEWENYTLVHKKVLDVKVIFGADCTVMHCLLPIQKNIIVLANC